MASPTKDGGKAALLAAVKAGNVQSWFAGVAAARDVDVGSLCASLDATAGSRLFDVLLRNVAAAFEEVDEAQGGAGAGAGGEENVDPAVGNSKGSGSDALVPFLRSSAELMHAYCEDKERTLPDSFLQLALTMQQAIQVLEFTDKTQRMCINSITRLCERLYLQGRADARQLGPMTLIVLLTDATGEDCSEATLKRLYAMRRAFADVDLEDEASEYMRGLMLKSFTMPRVLASATGRKVLGAIMTAGPAMPKHCHDTIKRELFTASTVPKASMQKWLAEVYVRAWDEAGRVAAEGSGSGSGSGSSGDGAGAGAAGGASKAASYALPPMRLRVEQDVLQDLLHVAIGASKPDVFRSLRGILQHLVTERTKGGAHGRKGLDAGLVRVYEARLWLALKAVNPIVRLNAGKLFKDVLFMGLHPDTAAELHAQRGGRAASGAGTSDKEREREVKKVKDRLMQEQVDALLAMVKDDCPDVRIVGVESIASALALYWRHFRSDTCAALLQAIIGLADDKSSPAVRAAVVSSITVQLIEGQVLSHPMLAGAGHLDTLAAMLHDSQSAKVRSAVVRMLEAVGRHTGSFPGSWYGLGKGGDAEDEEGGAGGGAGAGAAAAAPATPPMVQQVLARLALDQEDESVAPGLARLLGPFYFRLDKTVADKQRSKLAKAGGAGAGAGEQEKDELKPGSNAYNSALALSATDRLLQGLLKYETATLAFLRYAATLPTDVAPRVALASVAARMFAAAHDSGMRIVEAQAGFAAALAAGNAGSGEGEEGAEDEAEGDGFVRKKRGRAQLKAGGSASASSSTSASATAAAVDLLRRTQKVATLLKATVTLWAGLDADMAESMPQQPTPSGLNKPAASTGGRGAQSSITSTGSESTGTGEVNPETGGVPLAEPAFVTELHQIRKLLGRVVTVDAVAALLRAFSGAAGLGSLDASEGGGAAGDPLGVRSLLLSTRSSITMYLLDVAGKLPELRPPQAQAAPAAAAAAGGKKAAAKGKGKAGKKGGAEEGEEGAAPAPEDAEYATLVSSLWERLLELTPSQVPTPSAGLADLSGGSAEPSAQAMGRRLLSHLVQCLISFGRGPELLDNAMGSISATSQAVGAAMAKGGAGAAAASEEAVLQAAGIAAGGLVHPLLAPAILEELMKDAQGRPAGSGGSSFLDTGIFDSQGGRVTTVLNVLVSGMTGISSALNAGPAACASPAGVLAGRLAVVCTAAWAIVDTKSLLMAFPHVPSFPMPGMAVQTARVHARDAVYWVTSALLPALVSHAQAAKLGLAGTSLSGDDAATRAYASVLLAGRSIVTTLLTLASDLVHPGSNLGLATEAALGLLDHVSSTEGVKIVPLGGVDIVGMSGGAETTSLSPLDWLVDGEGPYIRAGAGAGAADEDEEDGEDGGAGREHILAALRMAAYRSHAAAISLAVRLWSAACGHRHTLYTTAAEAGAGAGAAAAAAAGGGATVQEPIVLEVSERMALLQALGKVMTHGELVKPAQPRAAGGGAGGGAARRDEDGDDDLAGGEDEDNDEEEDDGASSAPASSTLPGLAARELLAEVVALARATGAPTTGAGRGGMAGRKVKGTEGKGPMALAVLVFHLVEPAELLIPAATVSALGAAVPGGALPAMDAASLGCIPLAVLIESVCASKPAWAIEGLMTGLKERLGKLAGAVSTGSEVTLRALVPLAFALQCMAGRSGAVCAGARADARAVLTVLADRTPAASPAAQAIAALLEGHSLKEVV